MLLLTPSLSPFGLLGTTATTGAAADSPLGRARPAVRPRAAATAQPASPQDLRSPEDLRKGIANFYDRSSRLWEGVWGEHMHHGYYPDDQKKDHKVAQVDMIEAVLEWAGADAAPPASVLDVGCGIGGSTRHIARKYGCAGRGITLSPVQAERASLLSQEQGLGEQLSFEVADALRMPFADDSFDLVWSLESGEHMPDKAQFVSELARVCKPGGRVIIVTWCHRDLAADEAGLLPREERLLRRINRAFYLPRWCSVADYVALAQANGLKAARTADWTDEIKRFWPAVIRSAFRFSSILGLFRSGLTTLRGALVMPLMSRGYKRGLIKFGLITATKPLDGGGATASRPAPPVAVARPAPAKAAKAARPAVAIAMYNPFRKTYSAPPPDGFTWGDTF